MYEVYRDEQSSYTTKVKKRVVYFLLICAVVIVGFFLRIYPSLSTIAFPYDQTRDLLFIKQSIQEKNLFILGPVTDITGVHHGPIFYYYLTFVYGISRYSPEFAVLFMSGVFAIMNIVVAIVFDRMHARRIGFLFTVLFSFSYEMYAYARWISNPVLVIPLWMLFLIFSIRYFRLFSYKTLFVLGCLAGLMMQAQLLMGYMMLTGLYFVFRAPRKTRFFSIVVWIGGFFFGSLPIFLSEFLFRFQAMKGLIQFATQNHSVVPLVTMLERVLSALNISIQNSVFLQLQTKNIGVLFLILIGVLAYLTSKKEKHFRYAVELCLVSIVLFLPIFLTGKSPINFFFIALNIPVFFLVAFAFSKIRHVMILFFLCGFIITTQLWTIFEQASVPYVFIQQNVTLSERDEIVSFIHSRNGNKPFSVSVFGTPFGVKTTWSYYFLRHATNYNSELPIWFGPYAKGYVGESILLSSDHPAQIHVVIYEPSFSIDAILKDQFGVQQDEATMLVSRYEIRSHIIEFREPKQQP
ncbi:MAG: hypothetical protein UX04_C0001G0071 [Microgenomates group bacterium GW2011_GWF2_45_18]|nr:MAG: hypothetical protein UX04_C0001G0071 [Microgenomates group bacterium GW2011_GWF2_45_18]OGJ41637.1 MAG: hypothetical protein A2378_01995 [Candidatus Pacebacteria bacterium RIFOXYB1_FULL_44_10]